jgi:hypothetical protein
MTGKRDLAQHEEATLLHILEAASFEGATELRAQVPNTRVVGGGPTFLNLKVTGSVPRSAFEDGHIPVRAFVDDAEGEVESELLVWVKNGYLSALENAWYTNEAPTSVPPPYRLRLELE